VLEVSMSKASGILLIAVGVGVAAYAMPFDNEKGEAPNQEVFAVQVVKVDVANPATSMTMTAPKALPGIEPPTPVVKATPVSTEPKSVAPGKSAVVAIVPRAVEKPVAVELKAPPTSIPGDPVSLTRELQRELRRVGCYDGEINGSWTPASRRAMKLFTDRVNASLPMERPDYILLRLVQSSPERVCGAGCPSGQSIGGKGHCLPDAVLAQAARRGQPALPATSAKANSDREVATTSGWSTTTTVATRELPAVPEGRMALAGPNRTATTIQRGEAPAGPESGMNTPDAAASIDQPQQKIDRPSARQRKSKFAAVDNSGRRDEAVTRKKFGTWFFHQQDAWRN
jgi:hypothetical protein